MDRVIKGQIDERMKRPMLESLGGVEGERGGVLRDRWGADCVDIARGEKRDRETLGGPVGCTRQKDRCCR